MPAAARKPSRSAADEPTTRLMRVPAETYDIIARWAEKEKRYMNQQLAMIVEEWDAQKRGRARGK